MPPSTCTSANSRSAPAIDSTCRSSSRVTDTLTSDVVTTSTEVLKRSKTSNTRRRKPCASSIRVDVISTIVTPRLQATAASGRASSVGCDAISVPGASGLRLFRMRTGMSLPTAGRMVLGCRTLAPKYASSAASPNESWGTTCG